MSECVPANRTSIVCGGSTGVLSRDLRSNSDAKDLGGAGDGFL